MKVCTVCKLELPTDNYHKSKNTKDGYGYRCKDCDKLSRLSYRDKNRERYRDVSRKKYLKHRYGITPSDYEALLESQKGCCAICGSDANKSAYGKHITPRFSVDHCHETGKVRGLLCNNCNRGIGLLGDNPDVLEKALVYLRKTH